MQNKYPRHKLGDDGVPYGSGQAVITPKLGKAEALMWFDEMPSSCSSRTPTSSSAT
jgi:phage tail sheath gpL-like